MVATTTTASCFAPREMVNPPRIGQRSTLTLRSLPCFIPASPGRQHNAFLSPAFSVKNKPLSTKTTVVLAQAHAETRPYAQPLHASPRAGLPRRAPRHDLPPYRQRRLDGRRSHQARHRAEALARADPADARLHRRDGHRRHRRDRHGGRLAAPAHGGGLAGWRLAHPLRRRHRRLPHPHRGGADARQCRAAEGQEDRRRPAARRRRDQGSDRRVVGRHPAHELLGRSDGWLRPHGRAALALPPQILRASSRPCRLARRADHRADLLPDRRRGHAARRGAA